MALRVEENYVFTDVLDDAGRLVAYISWGERWVYTSLTTGDAYEIPESLTRGPEAQAWLLAIVRMGAAQ